MKTKDTYEITEDISASLTDGGYLLTIESQALDDYDCYKLVDGEWELCFDSLSNKTDDLDFLWQDKPDFLAWTNEMKTLANY